MKFDVVFSNPPYNGNLDIKIMNVIIDVSIKFIIGHPSTWLLDVKGRNKLFASFQKKLDKKIKSLNLFNGNPIFNIFLLMPCVITHIDNSYNGKCEVNYFNDCYEIDYISKFSKFGLNQILIDDFILSLNNHIKINGHIWSEIVDYSHTINDSSFYVQLTAIRGNENRVHEDIMYKDDFYTLVMFDSNKNKGVRNTKVRKDGFVVFEFQTEKEQNNFISYLKTDFVRFCLSLLKNNKNNHYGEMELIPWLDFTEEWDDDKLFAKFNVSQELQDYIREFLPDYYGIRK